MPALAARLFVERIKAAQNPVNYWLDQFEKKS